VIIISSTSGVSRMGVSHQSHEKKRQKIYLVDVTGGDRSTRSKVVIGDTGKEKAAVIDLQNNPINQNKTPTHVSGRDNRVYNDTSAVRTEAVCVSQTSCPTQHWFQSRTK